MPAKSIKLTYFNAKGRAELARLVLAQAGAEFEDIRLEREEWLNVKPSKSYFQSKYGLRQGLHRLLRQSDTFVQHYFNNRYL